MIGLINQRRPASASSRKSSLIRVYTNCLSIAKFTCLSRKASECKVSDVVHAVSARVCVCAVRGGAIIRKRVCCLFDVTSIVAINGNIFIQFNFFASGLNLYDGQLSIHVQFHVRRMKLAYVCS